jgi:hypothetical protein
VHSLIDLKNVPKILTFTVITFIYLKQLLDSIVGLFLVFAVLGNRDLVSALPCHKCNAMHSTPRLKQGTRQDKTSLQIKTER